MQSLLKSSAFYLLFLLSFAWASGCAPVKLVSDYDKDLLTETFALAKRVDLFWANYIEATENDRQYLSVKDEIIAIEVEMNSLQLKNAARAKNQQTTKQVQNLIEIWGQIGGLIKTQGSISNTSAKAYRLQIADAFKYIVIGENAKHISNNNTKIGD